MALLKKTFHYYFSVLTEKSKVNILQNDSCKIKNKNVFFGYYDLNPISKDNDLVLAIVTGVSKNTHHKAAIGYYRLNNLNRFIKIDETETWCWQQGCRLRWSNIFNNTIIFNKLVNNGYGCIFVQIESGKITKDVNYPLYDLTQDEKYGLSLNFSRLQRLRPGYGYSLLKDNTVGKNAPDNDGIFLVDITKNTCSLILKINTISKIKPKPSMKNAEHYINHISINPNGERFLFFHLWTKNGQRFSRLFTADLNGDSIYLLENEENVSHYSWRSNNEIILTTYNKNYGTRYSIYTDQTNIRLYLPSGKLNSDGHPSFCPYNKDLILSDTYPDKYGNRTLFFYNMKKESKSIIGSFRSPLKYQGEYRCDLHPRWNNDGSLITFDSTHQNKIRTLNILHIENSLYT